MLHFTGDDWLANLPTVNFGTWHTVFLQYQPGSVWLPPLLFPPSSSSALIFLPGGGVSASSHLLVLMIKKNTITVSPWKHHVRRTRICLLLPSKGEIYLFLLENLRYLRVERVLCGSQPPSSLPLRIPSSLSLFLLWTQPPYKAHLKCHLLQEASSAPPAYRDLPVLVALSQMPGCEHSSNTHQWVYSSLSEDGYCFLWPDCQLSEGSRCRETKSFPWHLKVLVLIF